MKGLRKPRRPFLWGGNALGLFLFRESVQYLLADLGQVVFVIGCVAIKQQINEADEDAPSQQNNQG